MGKTCAVTYLPGPKWEAKNEADEILDYFYLEVLTDKYQACHANAYETVKYLKSQGVHAKMVQGWVTCGNLTYTHSWIRIGKEHIDVTPAHRTYEERTYRMTKSYSLAQIEKAYRKEAIRQGCEEEFFTHYVFPKKPQIESLLKKAIPKGTARADVAYQKLVQKIS